MLSLGTELLFAFWIASARVGLPAGSAPPVRAATSAVLMSLAKSLPRRASTTAFLCFVVAHLEWPLIDASRCQRTTGALGDHRKSQDGRPWPATAPDVRGRSSRRRARGPRRRNQPARPTGRG